jgi:hypothetical protein
MSPVSVSVPSSSRHTAVRLWRVTHRGTDAKCFQNKRDLPCLKRHGTQQTRNERSKPQVWLRPTAKHRHRTPRLLTLCTMTLPSPLLWGDVTSPVTICRLQRLAPHPTRVLTSFQYGQSLSAFFQTGSKVHDVSARMSSPDSNLWTNSTVLMKLGMNAMTLNFTPRSNFVYPYKKYRHAGRTKFQVRMNLILFKHLKHSGNYWYRTTCFTIQ